MGVRRQGDAGMKVHIVRMYGNVEAICDNEADVGRIRRELLEGEELKEDIVEVETVETNQVIGDHG